jgi:phosphomethylpyrimidine synthase
MKIIEDVREYAEKMGVIADSALEKGMEEKAAEFVNSGSEIYS